MNWSEFNRGVFLVNALGIIYNPETKKVLIGRREKDPYIKELTWCFPGGRPGYEQEVEDYLKLEIKKKTGLEVRVDKIVFAKTYPEKREFLSIYYYCTATSGEERAGEKFTEIKWVKPEEVKDYFATSLHQKVMDFLLNLK
ncbi:NUDIX domain-containing protein [archaeon]|nr:NUDIX domain-containing protein [archaeon]